MYADDIIQYFENSEQQYCVPLEVIQMICPNMMWRPAIDSIAIQSALLELVILVGAQPGGRHPAVEDRHLWLPGA